MRKLLTLILLLLTSLSYSITTKSMAENSSILYASSEDEAVIDEDFHRFVQATNSNSDVSASLDQYLDGKGFSGTKLYKGKHGMKMSTTSISGELISPVLHESTGVLSFTISSEVYENDVATLTLNIYSTDDEWPIYTSETIPAGTTKTINLGNIPDTYRFIILSEKRCYMTRLIVTHPKTSPTDIIDVTDNSHASTLLHNAQYNLKGQKVGKDFRGLIIKRGKKFFAR